MPVPTDIPGLKLWLNPDVGTLQTSGGAAAVADADPVGQWQDQSGLANHANQVTSTKRLTLKLATNNGKSTMLMDAVDDDMATASVAHGIGTGDFWWVAATNKPDASTRALLTNAVTAPSMQLRSSLLSFIWTGVVGNQNFNTALVNGTFYILELMRVSGVIKGFVNGVQEATTYARPESMADGAIIIGTNGAGANPGLGPQGQTLFYVGSPTVQQRYDLITYLGTYYGLTVSPAVPPVIPNPASQPAAGGTLKNRRTGQNKASWNSSPYIGPRTDEEMAALGLIVDISVPTARIELVTHAASVDVSASRELHVPGISLQARAASGYTIRIPENPNEQEVLKILGRLGLVPSDSTFGVDKP